MSDLTDAELDDLIGALGLTEPPDLMTPKEAAAAFGVSTQAVRNWARAGHLHPITTPGGHNRYRTAEVRALQAATDQTDQTRESR